MEPHTLGTRQTRIYHRAQVKSLKSLILLGDLPLPEVSRILVVEDEIDLLEIMELHLESSGFHVFAAKSATEAKTVLKQKPVDLVVTDLSIYEGRQTFAEWVHLQTKGPVVMITGMSDEAIRLEKIYRIPLLYKPFTPVDLTNIIRENLCA